MVFLTGVFLNSAQTMIYATVSIRSRPDSRATTVGWTSGTPTGGEDGRHSPQHLRWVASVICTDEPYVQMNRTGLYDGLAYCCVICP